MLASKRAFELARSFAHMLLADAHTAALSATEREDAQAKMKLASLLGASAALELAAVRSVDNNQACSELF